MLGDSLRIPSARLVTPLLLCFAVGCAQLRVAAGPRVSGAELVTEPIEVEASRHESSSHLRFLVVGDAGTGLAAQRLVAESMLQVCAGECDFALVTGDNLYDVGVRRKASEIDEDVLELFERKFERAYADFGRFDFWMVTGNHDWYWAGTPRAEVLYSRHSPRWRMPYLDYAVPNLPPWITIYGLDTTLIEAGARTGQVSRADATLCDAPGWRVLFAHHPPYSVGKYGKSASQLAGLRERLLDPLIRPCAVDVFFSGHDHLQAHLLVEDLHVFVQGAGGRRLYDLDPSPWLPADSALEFAESTLGFALVEASQDELRVRFFSATDQGANEIYETVIQFPAKRKTGHHSTESDEARHR